MLTSFIAALAFAAALALPHGHAVVTAAGAHGHVTAFDGSGGGPPTHP